MKYLAVAWSESRLFAEVGDGAKTGDSWNFLWSVVRNLRPEGNQLLAIVVARLMALVAVTDQCGLWNAGEYRQVVQGVMLACHIVKQLEPVDARASVRLLQWLERLFLVGVLPRATDLTL